MESNRTKKPHVRQILNTRKLVLLYDIKQSRLQGKSNSRDKESVHHDRDSTGHNETTVLISCLQNWQNYKVKEISVLSQWGISDTSISRWAAKQDVEDWTQNVRIYLVDLYRHQLHQLSRTPSFQILTKQLWKRTICWATDPVSPNCYDQDQAF